MALAPIGIILALIIVLLYNTIKILKEYERGVILFLGRFQSVKGPGLIILIPGLQKMTKVDLRVIVLDVPTQDVISRDNVSVKVNAVRLWAILPAGPQRGRAVNQTTAAIPRSTTPAMSNGSPRSSPGSCRSSRTPSTRRTRARSAS